MISSAFEKNPFYLFLYKIASLLHQRCVASAAAFLCRPGGDRGGGVDSPAPGAAEPGCSQDLFCQGATRPAGSFTHLHPHIITVERLCSHDHICSLPTFRFAECSSCNQMANSSRPFPWQQTTSHRCSTCTSSTVGHFEHKRLKHVELRKNGCLLKA